MSKMTYADFFVTWMNEMSSNERNGYISRIRGSQTQLTDDGMVVYRGSIIRGHGDPVPHYTSDTECMVQLMVDLSNKYETCMLYTTDDQKFAIYLRKRGGVPDQATLDAHTEAFSPWGNPEGAVSFMYAYVHTPNAII